MNGKLKMTARLKELVKQAKEEEDKLKDKEYHQLLLFKEENHQRALKDKRERINGRV